MVKGVDVAVLDVVKQVIANEFKGGLRELGLKEKGVGFVSDERNRHLLPIEVVTRVRALSEEIVNGTIKVPSR